MGRHHYSFGSFIHDVGKVTKPIGHEISHLVTQVAPVVKPLGRDIKSLISGADKDFNHIINSQSNIANNLINKSSSAFSSLSMPLIIVGGCVAIYLVTKK
jgi:hypothetical protein